MKEDRPVLVAAGGTGGHLFPAEALSVALSRRGFAIELATDTRALKYGGTFPARAVHRLAAATPTGGSLLSKARAALVLAARDFGGAPPHRQVAAALRRRFRRLSDRAAGARGDAARRAGAPARAECRDRSRQSLPCAPRRCDRDRISDAARHRRKTAGESRPHRQSGSARRDRGGTHRLSRFRRRQAQASRDRRIAGRAHLLGCRSGGAGTALARSACAHKSRPAGPRRRRSTRARCLCATCRSLPMSRRFSPICRRAWPAPISSSRAPAPRPFRNSPSSDGRRSSCRSPLRSIRIRPPMPPILPQSGPRRSSGKPIFRRNGWRIV